MQSLRDTDPVAFAQYMRAKYGEPSADAPGPWTHETRRGRAIIVDADRNEVCEAFAAPALIAAAPELLDALREARVMVYAMTGDAPASAPWNALLPRIDAAIARATGSAA